jgi:hypothetical protein
LKNNYQNGFCRISDMHHYNHHHHIGFVTPAN